MSNGLTINGSYHQLLYLTKVILKSLLISLLFFMVAFVLLLFVYLCDMLLSANSTKNNKPLFSAYVIVSPSMTPTIKVNDAIILKRVKNSEYEIGDIITFDSKDVKYNDITITHRVVDKKEYNDSTVLFRTKGDNNNLVDPLSVKKEEIYGKVLLKIPKIGYVQQFFSKPSNFFLCIFAPTLFIIFYDLLKILLLTNRLRESRV